jgi:hypothetical protein
MALPNPKRNIILAPYCDNILNHDTNEGIVKLVTLMVKRNENITKMKVLQVHIRPLLKKTLYHQWPILQYFHVHIPTILHWSIYEFENIFPLYLMFN